MKMFISFKSQSQGAKFYVNAYYSATLTDDQFVNAKACSDGGMHLGDAIDGVKSGGGENDDNALPIQGIKIKIQSKNMRKNLINVTAST